jgi:hypothetical protein
MKDKLLVIGKTGVIRTLYSDDLRKLGGTMQIGRASVIEPNEKGLWSVVLTDHPLNGQYKGQVVAVDLESREEALKIEVDYINTHILGKDHANERTQQAG